MEFTPLDSRIEITPGVCCGEHRNSENCLLCRFVKEFVAKYPSRLMQLFDEQED
jgi:hypothetical protein